MTVLTRVFGAHPSDRLAAYADGQLSRADADAVSAHLARCARCRVEYEELQFAARIMRQAARMSAPDGLWDAIEAGLEGSAGLKSKTWTAGLQGKTRPTGGVGRVLLFGPAGFLGPAAAVAATVLVAAVAYWMAGRDEGVAPWEVRRGMAISRLEAGDLVEPGSAPVRVTVGTIGTVDVEPGSRLRLGHVRPNEYRMALERGTIRARILAPPRMFVVDTPASTVVDLGCAYTMHVDEDGAGELRMTEGWAALEWDGRESLVPAGAMARTRPRVGPGTPYFEDASAALKDAVDAFDFGGAGLAAVDTVLRESRVRDTLTLWHLLSRVAAADRERVYDRIATLVPPPPSVERDKVLQLDRAALTHLREELAWKW